MKTILFQRRKINHKHIRMGKRKYNVKIKKTKRQDQGDGRELAE